MHLEPTGLWGLWLRLRAPRPSAAERYLDKQRIDVSRWTH